jgi:hypothetical protein
LSLFPESDPADGTDIPTVHLIAKTDELCNDRSRYKTSSGAGDGLDPKKQSFEA